MQTITFAIRLLFLMNALLAPVFSQSTFVANLFSATQSGQGTYYGPTTGGNCGYGTLIPSFVSSITQVAINAADYAGNNLSEGCGMCLQMQGTGTGSGANPISTTPFIAFVEDQCPGCGSGGIDIALTGDGAWGITWIAVPCPVGSSTIQYQLQGSNAYYLKLQVIGSSIPVTDVALVIGGVNYPTTRTQDNFWNPSGSPPTPFVFPLTVLLTAYNGDTLTDTIPSLTNSVLLSGSGVQFPGTTTPTKPVTTPTPTTAPTKPATTPTPTAAPTKPATTPTPTKAPTKPATTPTPTTAPTKPATTPTPTTAPTKPATTPTPVSSTAPTCGDSGCTINANWVEWKPPSSFTGTVPATASVLCSGTTTVSCTWAYSTKYQCNPGSTTCSNPIPIWQGQQCPFPTPQADTTDQTALSEGGLSLSIAAIAGIAVGCVVLVVGLIVIVIVVKKRTHTEEYV